MPADRSELFHLVMIKPTHYDDDGYPITWLRSDIPSNTLARSTAWRATAASARCSGRCRHRHHADRRDQHRVRPTASSADIAQAGGKALICLVGVQSNQFPRAVDLARAVPRGRPAGGDGRLPRLRLPVDAARRCRPRSRRPWTWASRSSPARPRKAGSTRCCATPGTAR